MITTPRWISSSLQLSGSNYVDCGVSSLFSFGGTSAYTLEAWISPANLDADAPEQVIIGKWDTGTNGGEVRLSIVAGLLTCTRATQLQAPVETRLQLDTWTHVATTYDGQTMSLYVNGLLVNSMQSTESEPSYPDMPVQIGAMMTNAVPAFYFNGEIGVVMLWGTCRSADEVLADSVVDSWTGGQSPPNPQGLLAHYNFSGLPAIESSGNNLPFTYEGSPVFNISVPGLQLSGSGYADCGNSADLSFNSVDPYTLAGWFYPTAPQAGQQMLVAKYDLTGERGEYLVYLQDGVLVSQRVANQTPLTILAGITLTQPDWYHFATTFDGMTLRLYLNGNLQCAQSWGLVQNLPTSVNLTIGADATGKSPFTGSMQHVRVWNTALSGDEIRQWLYNHPSTGPLVADFDFTVNPPQDNVGTHPISLQPGATAGATTYTLDPLSADTQFGLLQAHVATAIVLTPDETPEPIGRRVRPAGEFITPFTDAHREYLHVELDERFLAGATPERRKQMHDRLDRGYEKARQAVEKDPRLLAGIETIRKNGMVTLVHHTPRGDVTVFSAAEVSVDACTLWWIGFIYQVTVGFLSAIGLVPPLGKIANGLYKLINASPTAMAAIESLLKAGGAITAAMAFDAIKALYDASLLWPIMKLVLTAAGWWTLFKILAQIIALLLDVEEAVLLAGFIVWAAQLTRQATEYSTACPARLAA